MELLDDIRKDTMVDQDMNHHSQVVGSEKWIARIGNAVPVGGRRRAVASQGVTLRRMAVRTHISEELAEDLAED